MRWLYAFISVLCWTFQLFITSIWSTYLCYCYLVGNCFGFANNQAHLVNYQIYQINKEKRKLNSFLFYILNISFHIMANNLHCIIISIFWAESISFQHNSRIQLTVVFVFHRCGYIIWSGDDTDATLRIWKVPDRTEKKE